MNSDNDLKRKRLYGKYNLNDSNESKIDQQELESEKMRRRAIHAKVDEATDLPLPVYDKQMNKEREEMVRRAIQAKVDEATDWPKPIGVEQPRVIYLAETLPNKKGKKSNTQSGKELGGNSKPTIRKKRTIDPRLKELKEENKRLKELLYSQGKELEFKTETIARLKTRR